MARSATSDVLASKNRFLVPERFARHDQSILAEWWWSVDRVVVFLMLSLCLFGIVAVFAAGASVADTINMSSRRLFAMKHLIFASTATALMFWLSFWTPRALRRLGVVLFTIGVPLLGATLLVGSGIKGAKRWLYFAGMQIQPSEFIKPAFVLLVAWLFAHAIRSHGRFPGKWLALVAYIGVATILLKQPDVGQTFLLTVVFLSMFFMTGASILWFISAGIGGSIALVGLYNFYGHVRHRIDQFLFTDEIDIYGAGYQMNKAQAALYSGGWWGKGPGEGVVKQSVPDAHSDYIFTIVGEEFGLIVCMMLITVYATIIYRSLRTAIQQDNHFIILAVTGLTTLFGMQAFINMAVNLGMLPPKGMTLPFVSYGGSSSLAIGMTAGILLSLTRRRVNVVDL